MNTPFPRQSRKLGEILIKSGRISEFQLNSALSHQRVVGGRLGASLIKLGYLTEEELLHFLAEQLGLEKIDPSGRTVPTDILASLPEAKARAMNVLPVGRMEMHGTVFLQIAMSDPTNLNLIDQLQFITGSRVLPVLATELEIKNTIATHYHGGIQQSEPEVVVPTAKSSSPRSSSPMTPDEKLLALLKLLYKKGVLTQQEFEQLR